MWEENPLSLKIDSPELQEWREDVAEFIAQPMDLLLQNKGEDLGVGPKEFAQYLAQYFSFFPQNKMVDPVWPAYMRWRLEVIAPLSTMEFREEGTKVYHRRVFHLDAKRVMYAGGGEMDWDKEVFDIISETLEPFRKKMLKRYTQSVGGSRDAFWLKFGEAFFMCLFHFDSHQADPAAVVCTYFLSYVEWRLGDRKHMRVVH